ncbi:MAG TPA: M20/M25/M40 family metallo-hydrolase [Bryobacteraceae bacterium]|nr:M20/M25/M40 family metallo-hydrolase [Bryobacteraceae bacterium]
MNRLLLSVFVIGCCSAANMPPEAEQRLAREIYKDMIEIKSGVTTGATTPVAQAVAARLRAAGFPDSDIFLGGPAAHKWNLVVRYHGSGARKPILLLAHTDVVEAKREDWTMDPFQFIEKDGYFYGRGTADDKAQAAIWVANLLRYKREGYKPDRDIIVALTADEEGGSYNGVRWLIENHRDLIDADFCLNEGGGGEMVDSKRISLNVQVAEKYVINYRLEVRNKGGHSSVPVPDNAIYQLAGALERLSHFEFPIRTNEVTRAYFTQLAKTETGTVAEDLRKVAEGSPEGTKQVAARYPRWNSMLRTTCVATMLEGGHAANALPQLAAATINCRVMPEDSPEYVEASLKKAIADDRVSVKTSRMPAPGPSSALRPDLMKQITRITDSLWPGVIVIPSMSTGATDGKALRAAGIETYGVSGLFGERGDVRAHGQDERMLAESFYQAQLFLYDLVKAL